MRQAVGRCPEPRTATRTAAAEPSGCLPEVPPPSDPSGGWPRRADTDRTAGRPGRSRPRRGVRAPVNQPGYRTSQPDTSAAAGSRRSARSGARTDGLHASGGHRISQQGQPVRLLTSPLIGSGGVVSWRAGQPPAGGKAPASVRRAGSSSSGAGTACGEQRAGLAGGEVVVHIQRSSYGLSVNDRPGRASKRLLRSRSCRMGPLRRWG